MRINNEFDAFIISRSAAYAEIIERDKEYIRITDELTALWDIAFAEKSVLAHKIEIMENTMLQYYSFKLYRAGFIEGMLIAGILE